MNEPTTCGPSSRIDPIIKMVCSSLEISETELRSRTRKRRICEARFIIGWLSRKYTRLTMETIGKELGYKDHTTIVYGIRSINKQTKNDKWMQETIRFLDGELEKILKPIP